MGERTYDIETFQFWRWLGLRFGAMLLMMAVPIALWIARGTDVNTLDAAGGALMVFAPWWFEDRLRDLRAIIESMKPTLPASADAEKDKE